MHNHLYHRYYIDYLSFRKKVDKGQLFLRKQEVTRGKCKLNICFVGREIVHECTLFILSWRKSGNMPDKMSVTAAIPQPCTDGNLRQRVGQVRTSLFSHLPLASKSNVSCYQPARRVAWWIYSQVRSAKMSQCTIAISVTFVIGTRKYVAKVSCRSNSQFVLD